ncbi:MAG: dienelactone hydrolase family protein [Firmicutes bacterium]|nr:dienelactone hydrolase family protein [Alicyclobacillaceae bacterium]MCL6497076.1 dienelactone hydrolase family protein [Bacillota bacterium]
MRAYLARPARVDRPLPAILVIQEIWGPDGHIQDVTRRFAAAGYTALAPDLYSRGGRPEVLSEARIEAVKRFLDSVPQSAWHDQSVLQAELQKRPQAEAQQLGETLGKLFGPRDVDGWVSDLKAWVDYLQASPGAAGQPVGSVGYCLGGMLSFALATAEPRLKVAQVYYGAAPAQDRLQHVACPVYGFYGEHDPRITEPVPSVAEAMRALGKTFEPVVYRGAGHAFFNDTRSSYHVDAARAAWARSLGLFAQYLAPAAS